MRENCDKMRPRRQSDLPGLRTALRNHTAETHHELDAIVGSFSTADQYRSFVLSSFQFRQVAEPACKGCVLWSPQTLVGDLGRDIRDLNLSVPDALLLSLNFETTSAKVGALYVLEGSSLGARLLLRRAERLGFSDTHGARHLARQTNDMSRWKAFLEMLDTEELDHAAATAGAQAMFECALAIYAEKHHELV